MMSWQKKCERVIIATKMSYNDKYAWRPVYLDHRFFVCVAAQEEPQNTTLYAIKNGNVKSSD